ncbi:MAG: heme o synthase [Actinomycetes bacterium]
MASPAIVPPLSPSAKVAAYVALMKLRVVELLLVTTVPVMVVANDGMPSLWLMVATVVGGTLSAGGANAINMVVDRDIDALMERTKDRPLVTGAITPRAALTFAIGLEVLAFVWLAAFVNLLSAVLALGACCFYVFVYTLWLKRTSTQNIVIGGAAGAVPVLIGWSSVTNSVSWSAVVLFGVVFFWTPPHFWALAIKYKDDYGRAGVPMLPAVADHRTTTLKMLVYSVVVVVLTLVFGWTAGLGLLYWAAAVVLGALFLWFCWDVRRTEEPARAIRLFTFSITYVTLLFVAMAADVLLRNALA